MLRTSLYCLPVLWLVFSCSAQGGVIERDWKVAGDGLLTFDDVNNREWLDLSESLLEKFPGETPEAKYQSVVAETNAGGLFEGFTVAKSGDVVALAQSAGINTETTDFNTNQIDTDALIDLLGATFVFSGAWSFAIGALDEYSDFPNPDCCRLNAFVEVRPPVGFINSFAGILFTSDSDAIRFSTTGVMLYRKIPEPSTNTMLSIWLTLMFTKRLLCSLRVN